MPPRKRVKKPPASQAVEKQDVTQNAQLNRLHRLIDAQLKKQQALDATEESEVGTIEALQAGIDKGQEEILQATDELLQDPFASVHQSLTLSDKERAAFRELHAALQAHRSDLSKETETRFLRANKSLVRLVNPRRDKKKREWQPKRFRILDPNDPDYDPKYESSSEEEYKLDIKNLFKQESDDIDLLPVRLKTDAEIAAGS